MNTLGSTTWDAQIHFVGSKRNQRRQQSHESIDQSMQRGLRRTSIDRIGARTIQSIAHYVDIQRTEVNDEKVQQCVIRRLKVILIVSPPDSHLKPLEAGQDKAVEFEHPSDFDSIARRIEIVQIPQHVTAGITNLAI